MKIKAFTSDQHFGHKNIIKFCNRPFYSVQHMTESLINNYNSVINDDDTVVWVGDAFFLNKETMADILKKLNGNKILIRGNHDKYSPIIYLEAGFQTIIDDFITLEFEGVNIKICHYPYLQGKTDWFDKYENKRPVPKENEILIHGHTHQKTKISGNMIHVGVDSNNYYPILYDEIIDIIKRIKTQKIL